MTDKTIADVLDNTVNHMANGVEQLTQAIQKIAPNAWKIAVHQQQLIGEKDMAIGVMFFIFMIIVVFYYIKYIKYWLEQTQEYNSEGYYALIVGLPLLAFMFFIPATINFTNGYVQYSGAEYYAAKDLLSTIK